MPAHARIAIAGAVLLSHAYVLSGCFGCGGPEEGEERGPCYPNGTCNLGLVCLSDLCIASPATDSGGSDAAPGAPDAGSDGATDSSPTDSGVMCGDSVREGKEECDGSDLAGADCTTLGQGWAGGILGCTTTCTFDVSNCEPPIGCGDGTVSASEQCDGMLLAGGTCSSQGFAAGTLACTPTCLYDTNGCFTCGDGSLGGPEVCDGANLGGATCASRGHDGGSLACAAGCVAFDEAACTDCADGTCDPGETCVTCPSDCGFCPLPCSDGMDSDGDALVDYPDDPGCLSPTDLDETDSCPGAGCPACGNGTDDDGDMATDFPADTGCVFAGDPDEAGCLYDFAAGSAMGWTFSNTCTTGVGWTIDTYRFHSPGHSMYYGNPAARNIDCSGLTNSGTATSPVISLPAVGAALAFWIWGSGASSCGPPGPGLYDLLWIEIDPASGPPTTIWDRCLQPETGEPMGMWLRYTVDLTAFASEPVQIVVHFDTVDALGNSGEGWYLDDITLTGTCP